MNLAGLLKRNDSASNDKKFDKSFWVSYGLTILKATLFAVILSVLLLLLTSVIMLFANIDDSAIDIFVHAARLISICFAGIICGRSVLKFGWIAGLLSGILYELIALLTGLIFYDTGLLASCVAIDFITAAGVGLIAGIIGINTRKR